MFGIGGWEFVLIGVLALLLFGPDKLPQFARTLGRFMRDFKRYQALMESTIRAEVFANDPSLTKDPFKTGKEFREKVAGSGFRAPEPKPAPAEEPPPADGESAMDESPVPPADGETATDGETAADAGAETPEPIAEDGEGERDEA